LLKETTEAFDGAGTHEKKVASPIMEQINNSSLWPR